MSLATRIPQPKAVYPAAGRFKAPPGAAVHCSRSAEFAGRRVSAYLGLPLVLDGSGWDIVVGAPAAVYPLGVPDRPDAYGLLIEPERIQFSAHAYRGLVYAAAALEELGNDCLRLVDFPDLEVRGFHLDLKGPALRLDYLRATIEVLGRLHINTLLIEYEDKFPYQGFPELVSPEAFSRRELHDLLALAADWGIEVIPLVQCLGHMQYVLKHAAHRHLAEDETLQQLCPLHDGALGLFTAMARELIATHPQARWLHIGGDESWSLGQCPRCSAFAAEHGKARLYLDYVKQVTEAVAAWGLRPILWDDMFHEEKAHPLLDELPPSVALMVWEYQVYAERISHLRWGVQQRYASRRYAREPEQLWGWSGWIEDLPADEQALIRAVKFGGGEMTLGDPLPWVKAIVARGREVFGAAAARGADTANTLVPSYDLRFANLAVWAGRAQHGGIRGVIGTAWSRFNSYSPPVEPWEVSWYTTLATAELCWNSRTTRSEFDERIGPVAAAVQWMVEGRRQGEAKYLHAALNLLARHAPDDPPTPGPGHQVNPAGGALPVNRAALTTAARFELLRLETRASVDEAQWHLHYAGEADQPRAAARAMAVQELQVLLVRWEAWTEEATRTFARELRPSGVQELLGTKVAGPMSELTWLIGRLSA